MEIYNCHIHTFSNQNVPDGFLAFNLLKYLRSGQRAAFVSYWLKRIIPFTNNDKLERLASFLDYGAKGSQKVIFQSIRAFYPRDAKFVVLALDMDQMGAGEAPKDYLHQLAELESLRGQYPQAIIPFINADPRREGVAELVKEYIDHRHFGGIKLYPPLGYYPFDEGLHDVYRFAEERRIPVITHCSRGGITFKGKVTPQMRRHPKTGKRLEGTHPSTFSDNYTHPENYRWVLEEFPNLKLSFAHYGGGKEWKEYLHRPRFSEGTDKSWLKIISDFIESYPNIYADIAFTAVDDSLWPLLKVLVNTPQLREKILFGSDAYMAQLVGSEREFSIGIRGALGEADYRQIAEINPKRFLAFERD
ncbi:MAG TPA: amidohydrolase family protein [Chloroflexi bacterium]|nr:amidohydrolase family protein [Chloroflexota bacterium]